MGNDEQIEIEKLVLINALRYKGKANPKSVLGSVMKEKPEYRTRIKEVSQLINGLVNKINTMSVEEQNKRLKEIDPSATFKKEKKEKKVTIDLPNVDDYQEIVLRLAPYPSGPLHIGNSRMVLLNDYCAKKYNGKLLLVFDDTIGSEKKIIDPMAYDMIPEDLDYLGVKIHGIYYKSDRLQLFYSYAVDLIKKQEAYVCDCEAKLWREKYKNEKKNCPCRNLSIEENLDRWEKMLDGTYPERGAVVRLKSGMALPDPALRDVVLLRISERDHPRVGDKYRVWPLLEFSWGIDDHELGMSHIIRGKDLRKEGIIEEMIWDIYGWKKPSIVLYGRMKIDKIDYSLSKSRSASLVRTKEYQGWSDPRTWSIRSLKRRGIQAQAIRKALLDLGMSTVDVRLSPDQIYSFNRLLIDDNANRYFMVYDPVKVRIKNIPAELNIAKPFLHPDHPERGTRKITLEKDDEDVCVWINRDDLIATGQNNLLRLKDFCNVIIEDYNNDTGLARFNDTVLETARQQKAKIVQWVPCTNAINTKILNVDGNWIKGYSEPDILKIDVGTIIQFERYAFCRLESKQGNQVSFVWTHH